MRRSCSFRRQQQADRELRRSSRLTQQVPGAYPLPSAETGVGRPLPVTWADARPASVPKERSTEMASRIAREVHPHDDSTRRRSPYALKVQLGKESLTAQE